MNMRIDRTKTEACVGGIHGVSRGSGHLLAIWWISSRWRLSRLIFAARCLKIVVSLPKSRWLLRQRRTELDELYEKGLLPYSSLDARSHGGGNPNRLSASRY